MFQYGDVTDHCQCKEGCEQLWSYFAEDMSWLNANQPVQELHKMVAFLISCSLCKQLKMALYIIFHMILNYAENKLYDCCGPFKINLKWISSVNSSCLGANWLTWLTPLNTLTDRNTFVGAPVQWWVGSCYMISPQNTQDAFTMFVLPSATLIPLKAADGLQ